MENMNPTADESQDLLSGTLSLVQASKGKRFANYLIDTVVFIIVAVVFFAVLAAAGVFGELFYDEGAGLLDRLVTMVLFGLLWGATEALFKGKTLGKLITGTRAVNEDGSQISTKTAFLRGFSRIVPFEAFSALGDPSYPWHDKWTHTYVIDEKTSIIVG